MLVQSLFGVPFKIPVWFEFDTVLRKETLFDIIRRIRNVGYRVVCNCCDMGNEGLGNSLQITPEKTWYELPDFPGEKIFFFYDVPHLLKLMRNHLLNEGFVLP